MTRSLPPGLLSSLLLALGMGACGPATGGGSQSESDLSVTPADMSTAARHLIPPEGMSSGGSGGDVPVAGAVRKADTYTYRLIVPDGVEFPAPLLIVYSGVEGGAAMTQNLTVAAAATGTDGFIRAVLDGKVYYGVGQAGAAVLDDVRAQYDIDNDRTYLIGESAGTSAALQLGFELRQSYFAAYWANDVNAAAAPLQTADELGFAPWGQVGPGGDFVDAQTIVDGMREAGYRLPDPAPYSGSGAGQHGSKDQFVACLRFFPEKTRQ